MKRSTACFAGIIFALLTYGYGVITVQYKTFPFEEIRYAKRMLMGQSLISRSPHYLHRKSFFEELGQNKYDAVFIGDSLTESAEWEDIFPEFKIANRGIAGDTSGGVLERIDSILSTKARKSFVMIGINDFNRGSSVDAVFENYREIIKNLLEHEFEVYIQSTILGGRRESTSNRSIISLNKKLDAFSSENNNITYIDLNRDLSRYGFLKP
ncbi:GDSL-type esterase/lipase family protein, partial [Pseudomonadales bacterium]|nr:GDSL-type esterase/lipase family protein [Pseudomonadales bacterium]